MTSYKTILIDDEAIARKRLASLLEVHPDQFTGIAEAKNGIEGAKLINHLKPDVVFLDIQMPGKTGFEILEDLTFIPKIVFCTAYEEYALKAFDTLALDYLVKPVEAERLQLTLEKLKVDNQLEFQVQELLGFVKQQNEIKKLQSIPHKIGDRVILVKTEQVTHLYAKDKYVEFFKSDGSKYLTELSLKKLLERLPEEFIQIQRSIVVNRNFVKEYRKYFRGKFILILDDTKNTRIETGRSYTEKINELLNINT